MPIEDNELVPAEVPETPGDTGVVPEVEVSTPVAEDAPAPEPLAVDPEVTLDEVAPAEITEAEPRSAGVSMSSDGGSVVETPFRIQ